MKQILIIILFTLLSINCNSQLLFFFTNNNLPDIRHKIAYFEGNSITYGSQINRDSSFASRLSRDKQLTMVNNGIGSSMLTNYAPQYATAMLDRLNEIPQYTGIQCIFFEFGINDSYLGRRFEIAQLDSGYNIVIDNLKAKNWDMHYVFIMDIPYYTSASYQSISKTVEMNLEIKRLCKVNGINYVPIYQYAIDHIANYPLIDGVHPDKDGHKTIEQCILKYIQ